MTSPGTIPPAVPDEAVHAAEAADLQWARDRREAVWQMLSTPRTRNMLEGAFPGLVTAAARAVAEMERAEAAEARLAEIRQTLATFFTVHGNSNAASLTHARDLAEGIRQILDREPAP